MNTKTVANGAVSDSLPALDSELPAEPDEAARDDTGTRPVPGLSPLTPIVITASTPMAGVPAEYAWLRQKFGPIETEWTVDLRSLGRNAQGRTIETFRLRLKSGARIDVHFDITSFHQL